MAKPCAGCGFELWSPIGELSVSELGLYSDARFPGRAILRLIEHFDSLEEVPTLTLNLFMEDVKKSMALIRAVTGSPRVNMAILGNTEPHVHAHLIPRFPGEESLPHKSPWDDPRPREPLEKVKELKLLESLRAAFVNGN